MFLGLDLSLSCTGMAAIDSKGYIASSGMIQTKPASGLAGRMNRFDHISKSVSNFVKAHSPCHVLLEGYSFGSKGRSVFDIAECGGIVKHALITGCPGILSIDELAPSSLQKTVTGFGGGRGVDKKQAMKDAVEAVFGKLGYKKSDQYDALGLALVAWWRSHE
jgi:Holliday junction resolvasome RuvABC endonuclease subunit